MASISGKDPVSIDYTLNEVLPLLDRRLQDLSLATKLYRSDQSLPSEAHFDRSVESLKDLAEAYFEAEGICEKKISEIKKLNERVAVLTKSLKGKRISRLVHRILVRQFVPLTNGEKSEVNWKIQSLKLEESKLKADLAKAEEDKKILEAAVNLKNSQLVVSDVKESVLETKVRTFDEDTIRKQFPKFNQTMALSERFNSFVKDIKRPLIEFKINGVEVFNKAILKNKTDLEVMQAVVEELAKHKLSIEDFYKVLELFHQGALSQGSIYFSQNLPMGIQAKCIGPKAEVELQIEGGRLVNLVSNANYVITDVEAAEEKKSVGVLKEEGMKLVTTKYNFQTEEVKLSVVTIPVSDQEIKHINADYFNNPSLRE